MKISKPICFLTSVYAFVVLTLGIMGYQKAGSLISLIVGGSLGALLLITSFFMFLEKKAATYLAMVITFVLGVSFAVRFSQTTNFMPASMALFSAMVLIGLILQTYKASVR